MNATSWRQTNLSTNFNVSCLGVILDTEPSMVPLVRGVTSRCFYLLRQICAIRNSLTAETSKLHVHALISSRLDHCNRILYGVGAVHLRKMQSVQNGSCSSCRTKTKIRPHLLNTSRRFALAACGIANPLQAVHAYLQESSWYCFGIYIAEMCIRRSFVSEH